jgi:hypothetical protein
MNRWHCFKIGTGVTRHATSSCGGGWRGVKASEMRRRVQNDAAAAALHRGL